MTLADTRAIPDHDRQTMLANVMKATGLPREAVEELYMTDSDLDDLCDTVLSDLASPVKKVSATEA